MAGQGLAFLSKELAPPDHIGNGQSKTVMPGFRSGFGIDEGSGSSARSVLDAEAAMAVGLDEAANVADGDYIAGGATTDLESMGPEPTEELGGRLVFLVRPDMMTVDQMLQEAIARRPSLQSILCPDLVATGRTEADTGTAGAKVSSRSGSKASARNKASSRGGMPAQGNLLSDGAMPMKSGQPRFEVWVNGRRGGSVFRWDVAAGTAAVRSAGAAIGTEKMVSEAGPSAMVRGLFSAGRGKTLDSLGLSEEVAARGLVHVVVRVVHPQAAALAR